MEGHEFGVIVEAGAGDIVDEAFGRRALGQQQPVPGQLDMVVGEALGRPGLLADAVAIDQRMRLHQQPVQQQRMIGRDQQVALWQPLGQRAGADADGRGAGRVGEAARDALPADPAHRLQRAIGAAHPVADGKLLDGPLAILAGDARAGQEADGVIAGGRGDGVEHAARRFGEREIGFAIIQQHDDAIDGIAQTGDGAEHVVRHLLARHEGGIAFALLGQGGGWVRL
ncbi:hypothetical protein PFY06_21580 (plasmid) [Pseudoroseomonas cervicalis]|nr:hypothetical protein [Pseudoroseomonas cervicalis]WBV45472.1 hypothetical protein PFY06_21580 [Pseudoroseomonas cervicalis]